jgi:hypothetical protein
MKLKITLTILIHLLGIVIALFFIWGWFTVADLKAQTESQHLDWETVAIRLMSNSVTFGPNNTITIDDGAGQPLGRFALRSVYSYRFEDEPNHSTNRTAIDINWLALVLRLTDNTLAFATSMSVGYIVGVGLVLMRIRHGKIAKIRHALVEPAFASLGAATAFLIIIAGANLLWDDVRAFRRMSLPLLALIGALQARKLFDRLSKIDLVKGSPSPEVGE